MGDSQHVLPCIQVPSFGDVTDRIEQVNAQIALGKRLRAPNQQENSTEQANDDSRLRSAALAREKRTKVTC